MSDESPEANSSPAKRPLVRRLPKLVPKPKEREQSSIAFPYVDIETAISLASAMLSGGGVPLSREQIAGLTNSSNTSGAFLTKLSAARLFGFIASNQNKFELTNLGFSVLDKETARQKAARAEAFLNVPLYRRVYDEFRGKQLPPRPHGLEQAFVRFGVSNSQKTNARLAFDKSAAQAGFFPNGPDRLIEPIIGAGLTTRQATADLQEAPDTARIEMAVRSEPDVHPFVRGLIDALPEPGTNWTVEGRAKWLQAAANNFDLMYKGDGQITINAKTSHVEAKAKED